MRPFPRANPESSGSLDDDVREKVLRVFRTQLTTRRGFRPNFDSLADELGMSTKQLSAHWLSMETLASDALIPVRLQIDARTFALSRIERLEFYLGEIDRAFDDPYYQATLTLVVRWASRDESAGLSLLSARIAAQRELSRLVGPISQDNYVQLVGPIYFNRLHNNGPISRKMMRMVVDRGMTLLGLQDAARD